MRQEYLVVMVRCDRADESEPRWRPTGLSLQRKPTSADQPHLRYLAVDLDSLLPVDATDEQRAMHAERMALHWAAEFDRLAPCLGGHPPRETEAVRMRAVIEAMRPIVTSALAWGDATTSGISDEDIELGAAIEDNRERLALCMSAWENSQTLTAEERIKARPSMLSPQEWSALFEMRRMCDGENEVAYSLGPELRPAVARAIDKLREQAGGGT